MLTNVCLLYFKKGESQPRKFKILNNFIPEDVSNTDAKKLGKPHVIKMSFSKKLVAKDNYIAVKSANELQSWMDAFKEFQIDVFRKRVELFKSMV